MLPGITNPINTSPTDPFVFTTYAVTVDGDYGIDSFEGANIQMLTPAEIQQVTLKPSDYTNSKLVTLDITLVPSVPMSQGMGILLTFPR